MWRQSLALWRRVKSWALRLWRALGSWLAGLKPRGVVLQGVARGATLAVFALGVIFGITLRSPLGGFVDPVVGIALATLFLLGGVLAVRLLMWLLHHLRGFLGALGLAAFLVLAALLANLFEPPLALPVSLALVILGASLGGAIAALRAGLPKGRSWVPALVLAVGLATTLSLVLWLRGQGDAEHLITVDDPATERVRLLDLEDPSSAGAYDVSFFTYGSGEDLRRPEFREVDVVSEAVDASPYTEGYKEGWRQKLRNRYWGFEPDAYPRNGRVWAPEGAGPFPLVLIVHGNHHMADFSDPGYEYLGRHLASRGMILVSVDENFLNGSPFGGVPTENDARGWMLLQHLALWRQWQQEADPDNPLAGLADLDRIALIGHSRGGEAAAIAAFFNRLEHYPDDATEAFDFGFAIRGVIAIAPSDGQYRPADRRATLEDVSYLVIQGGHDADVSAFAGDRQWNRVSFDEDSEAFKASLYAYRANHGQFNTVWGRTDFSMPLSWFLNLAPLHDSEDQRRIGKVLFTAFLEVVLHDRREYLPLFRDPRCARHWLPEDLYLSRYEDASFRLLTDYEEDLDPNSTALDRGRIEASGLTLWREGDLKLRRGSRRENNVVVLGWKDQSETAVSEPRAAAPDGVGAPPDEEPTGRDGTDREEPPASYRIDLPEGLSGDLALVAGDRLMFALAALDESAPDPDDDEDAEGEETAEDGEDEEDDAHDGEDADEDDDGEEEAQPIDLSIELLFEGDRRMRTTLSEHRLLLPPLPMRFTRLDGVEEDRYGSKAEPVLQTFELPLGSFEPIESSETEPSDSERSADPLPAASPDWSSLRAVRFVFDRTPTGVVAFDRIGFSLAQPRDPSP